MSMPVIPDGEWPYLGRVPMNLHQRVRGVEASTGTGGGAVSPIRRVTDAGVWDEENRPHPGFALLAVRTKTDGTLADEPPWFTPGLDVGIGRETGTATAPPALGVIYSDSLITEAGNLPIADRALDNYASNVDPSLSVAKWQLTISGTGTKAVTQPHGADVYGDTGALLTGDTPEVAHDRYSLAWVVARFNATQMIADSGAIVLRTNTTATGAAESTTRTVTSPRSAVRLFAHTAGGVAVGNNTAPVADDTQNIYELRLVDETPTTPTYTPIVAVTKADLAANPVIVETQGNQVTVKVGGKSGTVTVSPAAMALTKRVGWYTGGYRGFQFNNFTYEVVAR